MHVMADEDDNPEDAEVGPTQQWVQHSQNNTHAPTAVGYASYPLPQPQPQPPPPPPPPPPLPPWTLPPPR